MAHSTPQILSKKSRSSPLADRSARRKASVYDQSSRKEKSVEEALKKFESLSLSRSNSSSPIASFADQSTSDNSMNIDRESEHYRFNSILRKTNFPLKREKIVQQILSLRAPPQNE